MSNSSSWAIDRTLSGATTLYLFQFKMGVVQFKMGIDQFEMGIVQFKMEKLL